MMVGVPVDLPRTSSAKVSQTRKPLIVSLHREGKVFVREEEVTDRCDGFHPTMSGSIDMRIS